MTIPTLPGWGDEFAKLPQIGQQLAQIIAPQRYAASQLRQAIQQDPRLLATFATIAKDNPAGIAKMFGKDAAGFLGALNETPEAQLARSKATATLGALGDAGVSRDAGLIGATGQTADQRRQGTATADVAELNADQHKTIKAAIDSIRATNPEMYNKLSEIGALQSYFGTDPNEAAINQNKAEQAGSEMEARKRVDAILGMSPKDAYKAFQDGKMSMGDFGNALDDPRSQMLGAYFKEQMAREHDAFMLDKQARLEAARDSRLERSQAGMDERLQKRLEAEKQKQDEADKKVQERQLSYNDTMINNFIARANPNSKTPMSDDQIAASIPQVNELLQRNQIIKGLAPESAPKFVMDQTGGFLGFGQHSVIKLINPDGSENASYNKETKRTETSNRGQTKGDSTSAVAKKEQTDSGSSKLPSNLSRTALQIIQISKSNGLSREAVTGHASFKGLSKAEQDAVIKALGF